MYWSGNYVELNITKNDARMGYHQGMCDGDIAYLKRQPKIRRQLKRLDPDKVRRELKGYGAWDSAELDNHEENLSRILWIACGDIQERSAS